MRVVFRRTLVWRLCDRIPLSYAAGFGNGGLVRLLMEADSKENDGRTPLLHAALGYDTGVRLLVLRDGLETGPKDDND